MCIVTDILTFLNRKTLSFKYKKTICINYSLADYHMKNNENIAFLLVSNKNKAENLKNVTTPL